MYYQPSTPNSVPQNPRICLSTFSLALFVLKFGSLRAAMVWNRFPQIMLCCHHHREAKIPSALMVTATGKHKVSHTHSGGINSPALFPDSCWKGTELLWAFMLAALIPVKVACVLPKASTDTWRRHFLPEMLRRKCWPQSDFTLQEQGANNHTVCHLSPRSLWLTHIPPTALSRQLPTLDVSESTFPSYSGWVLLQTQPSRRTVPGPSSRLQSRVTIHISLQQLALNKCQNNDTGSICWRRLCRRGVWAWRSARNWPGQKWCAWRRIWWEIKHWQQAARVKPADDGAVLAAHSIKRDQHCNGEHNACQCRIQGTSE